MTGPSLLAPTTAEPLATALSALIVAVAAPYLALLLLALRDVARAGPPGRAAPLPGPPPSVSVVVPAHDEERSLPALIDALQQQRYDGPVEFVLVDDRSRDRTGALIRAAADEDRRVVPVRIDRPDRRAAPKVHAVARGIRASCGEIVLTTDADCVPPPGWIDAMVRHLGADGTMVVGTVETALPDGRRGWVQRLEAIDWLALMLVSRTLARSGRALASSANNQGYRRAAFEAAGGFGATRRAPSGDEDLLVQRLGRLPGARIVFAGEPDARVRTEPSPSWWAFLGQRRRWVSRYRHAVHYRPSFLAMMGLLAAQSATLAAAVVALPWLPQAAPAVASAFAAQVAVQAYGVARGARQFGRHDLVGPELLAWAVLYPFVVATVTVLAFARSGEWRAGAAPYRRRWWRRRVRTVLRAFPTGPGRRDGR